MVKVPVVHLRIAMLAINLTLAVGLGVYYVKGLLAPAKPARSVAIVEAEKFRNVRNVRPRGADPTPVVSTAAQYMLPPEPREATPIDVSTPEEGPGEEEPEEEEPTEGGPLAEEWEYVWGIYDQENPLNSLVMLRRKEDGGTRGRARIGSRTGRRFSSARNRRASLRNRRQAQNPQDLITFQVKDRHYVDEDNDIDIWIHRATREALVYSESRNELPAKTRYALKRTFTTQYEERGATESLWELGPLEEDEEAQGEEEEEEKNFIIVRESPNYEDLREMQYRKALEGEKVGTKAISTRRRRIIGAGSSAAQPGVNVNPARPAVRPRSAPAGSGAAGGRITDPEERRRQMQELEEAVKELPPEAQKEVQEALTNPPQEEGEN